MSNGILYDASKTQTKLKQGSSKAKQNLSKPKAEHLTNQKKKKK